MRCHFTCWIIILLLEVTRAGTLEVSPSLAPVKVEETKNHYIFQEPVVMIISNTSDHLIMCGIGVQKLDNGKWRDFATNIDDREPYSMTFGYNKKLQPHSQKTVEWKPKLYPKSSEARSGMYRIFIAYQVGDNDYRIFYLEPFQIE